MQFINTFEGVKTRCVCKPDQTLFPPPQIKTEKSGLVTRDYCLPACQAAVRPTSTDDGSRFFTQQR